MAAPRITGKLAALFMDANVSGGLTLAGALRVADIFDWAIESQAEVFECSIKEESYDRYETGGANARLTAQRYLTTPTLAVLSSEVVAAVRVTATAGKRVAWYLQPISTQAEGATLVNTSPANYIAGFGWVTRGTLTAPRGMMVDSFELQIDGEWQYLTATVP